MRKEEEMNTYVFHANNVICPTKCVLFKKNRQIHTEGIEGAWKHAKAHLKAGGSGTRESMIQERLDEFIFHRTYLRDQPMNVWIMLRLLGKYGNKAYKFVTEDAAKAAQEDNYYRCDVIQEDEKISNDQEDVAFQNREWRMDENNNLVRVNEYGDVMERRFADNNLQPEIIQQQIGDYVEMDPERELRFYELGFDVGDVDPCLANRVNDMPKDSD